jgi:23S rRNA pseudouridine1911/1915/1917 synthase
MDFEKIDICFIEEFPSVEEGIFYLNPSISKSKLKSLHLKKNFLNKKIKAKDLVSFPIELINHLKINPKYTGPNVEIIFEDNNFLVLSKPENCHIHPLNYLDSNNLLSWMKANGFSKYLDINKEHYDRGLLYRLDFETSGIVYYAKSDTTYHLMREQFNKIVKQKKYLAVVQGVIKEDFNCTHYLFSTHQKGHYVHASDDPTKGKRADIKVKVLASNNKQSFILVELNQGSRHQIRVQLAASGFPILGDTKYGADQAQRLYLHCFQYCFSYKNITYNQKDSYFNELNSNFAQLSFLEP